MLDPLPGNKTASPRHPSARNAKGPTDAWTHRSARWSPPFGNMLAETESLKTRTVKHILRTKIRSFAHRNDYAACSHEDTLSQRQHISLVTTKRLRQYKCRSSELSCLRGEVAARSISSHFFGADEITSSAAKRRAEKEHTPTPLRYP